MINIEAFFLCDAATGQNGKLNVLGAFDVIRVKKLPATHSTFWIVVRIRSDEAGHHSIKVKITDKDNKVLPPKLMGGIDFKIATSSNLILGVTRMRFEYYGEYKFDLIIDGKTMATLPLHIKAIEKGE